MAGPWIDPDSSPETCQSQVRRVEIFERAWKDGSSPEPPVRGRGRQLSSVRHRIGPLRHAVYAQGEKARRCRRSALDQQPWIALDDSAAGSHALMWLAQSLPLEQVTLRFSGLLMVRSACAQGLGLAVLPCFLGDTEPGLARMGDPVPMCDSEHWLLSHPELRETVRVKALRQWLLKALSAQADLLAGKKPLPS